MEWVPDGSVTGKRVFHNIPPWIANRKDGSGMRYMLPVCLSCPPWLDRKALYTLNRRARLLSESTGVLHVLDHIEPVNNPYVCGLTVPWNLEIVTNDWNNRKGNARMHLNGELFPKHAEPHQRTLL